MIVKNFTSSISLVMTFVLIIFSSSFVFGMQDDIVEARGEKGSKTKRKDNSNKGRSMMTRKRKLENENALAEVAQPAPDTAVASAVSASSPSAPRVRESAVDSQDNTTPDFGPSSLKRPRQKGPTSNDVEQENLRIQRPYFYLQPGQSGHDTLYAKLLLKKPLVSHFVGVITTGIACRFGCKAGSPLKQNVVFTKRLYDLISLGFRECKKCKPLSHSSTGTTQSFLDQIQSTACPRKGIESSYLDAKAWVQQTHDADLMRYINMKRVHSVLQNQGAAASYTNVVTFEKYWTPIGAMVGCFSKNELCLLEFADRRMLESELLGLQKHHKAKFAFKSTQLSAQLGVELNEYFNGNRTAFTLPLERRGSDFQLSVLRALEAVPFGKTSSYASQAKAIGQPKAIRAVAKANGNNCISILFPCHRIVGDNGQLLGYGGGLDRKRFLLNLEQLALKASEASAIANLVIQIKKSFAAQQTLFAGQGAPAQTPQAGENSNQKLSSAKK